ncbi:MAG: PD-(D/E)XK nuclease family protein, partial [Sphaerochaetaceae bacterium]
SKNNRGLDASKKPDTLLQMLTDSLHLDIENPLYTEGILQVKPIESIPEYYLYSGEKEEKEVVEARLKTAGQWYDQASAVYQGRPLRVATTKLHPLSSVVSGELLPACSSDAILNEYTEEQITGFGTFVHALCEHRIMDQEPEDLSSFMPDSLLKVMKAQELVILEKDAMAFCDGFMESELYKREVEPYSRECEVGFFSAVEYEGRPIVAEGAIDLLVKQDDGYLVIDFKTDKRRDETIHRFQLETYMQAMKRIHQCQVRGCVVYLRDPAQVIMREG